MIFSRFQMQLLCHL